MNHKGSRSRACGLRTKLAPPKGPAKHHPAKSKLDFFNSPKGETPDTWTVRCIEPLKIRCPKRRLVAENNHRTNLPRDFVSWASVATLVEAGRNGTPKGKPAKGCEFAFLWGNRIHFGCLPGGEKKTKKNILSPYFVRTGGEKKINKKNVRTDSVAGEPVLEPILGSAGSSPFKSSVVVSMILVTSSRPVIAFLRLRWASKNARLKAPLRSHQLLVESADIIIKKGEKKK